MASYGVDLQSREAEHEVYSVSLSEVLMSNLDPKLSPFRSSSVLYSSNLKEKVEKGDGNQNSPPQEQHEEVIKPADKDTMLKFIENATAKSELFFQFSLPTVNLVFPTKDFFEMVYNRLSNDLLLWQRTAITSTKPYDLNGFRVHVPGLDLNSQLMNDANYDKSNFFKSYSNDSDSEEEGGKLHTTCNEHFQLQKFRNRDVDCNHPFTALSLLLEVEKGMLTINTPALDDSSAPIPDSCGKLQLYIEKGCVFVASSYRGDPNEGYLCVLADNSQLYHKAVNELDLSGSEVEPLRNSRSQLNRIISRTEPGMRLKSCDKKYFCDMLKIAAHIVHNPKQDLKSFKIAIDIAEATLRHYVHCAPQMWINQLIDFLRVGDFSVNGYDPPQVITEFHLNLSNCSIDYRPLKLPVRSFITLENFNMSCNISVTTPVTLFRIISEELRIFLSNSTSAGKVELKKNFVCVIDTGLIDISCRAPMEDKDDSKFELSVSNNIVHVRTCADSFKALIDLIIYLSTNGDMETLPSPPSQSSQGTEDNENDTSMPEDSPHPVKELVAEAMMECPTIHNSSECNTDSNRNLTGMDDHYVMDDEFVILDDDPGLGYLPKNGEPVVRMLTDEPIVVIENHFAIPHGKSDGLKAPTHYPNPKFIFTLRELSLVWHIYGGSDFSTNSKKRNSKKKNERDVEVTFADEKNINIGANNAVGFYKVTPKDIDENTVVFSMEYLNIEDDTSRKTALEVWLQKGGPNRNHDILMELQMNKVKFQREIYPENGEHASRCVLLMHEIEIRDRLKSSEINKFLYQYSSQKIPKQSNANMVEVKCLYVRPDPKQPNEECCLKVSCKPLRLNVDQDSLCFLISFFKEVFENASKDCSDGDAADAMVTSCAKLAAQIESSSHHRSDCTSETFYKYFSFCPDVLIRIDYHGKHVQMEEGALRGFLMGLTQLNSSEIRLKRLCYRNGLLGHQKVFSYATSEWQQDIIKHQLQNVLSGVGPINSIVQLFQGVKDLFYLPVAQYQKDGQIIRGLQRGAASFTTLTANAFLELSTRVLLAIQGVAIISFDVVSPGPSVANKLPGSHDSFRTNRQSADIREGMANALVVVKEGLGDTLNNFVKATYAEHEHKGALGAVGGSLRQIPPLIIKPVIVASEATNTILGGIRHQLVPDAHQEDLNKWRTRNS